MTLSDHDIISVTGFLSGPYHLYSNSSQPKVKSVRDRLHTSSLIGDNVFYSKQLNQIQFLLSQTPPNYHLFNRMNANEHTFFVRLLLMCSNLSVPNVSCLRHSYRLNLLHSNNIGKKELVIHMLRNI